MCDHQVVEVLPWRHCFLSCFSRVAAHSILWCDGLHLWEGEAHHSCLCSCYVFLCQMRMYVQHFSRSLVLKHGLELPHPRRIVALLASHFELSQNRQRRDSLTSCYIVKTPYYRWEVWLRSSSCRWICDYQYRLRYVFRDSRTG